MFPNTPGFRAAVTLCNQVADAQRDRFVPFLERVLDKLHIKDERPFNDKEESQLEQMFGIGPDDLHHLMSLTVYAFQQAAYHAHSAEALGQALADKGATKIQVKAFQHVWNNGGPSAIKLLRAQSFGATAQLEGVDWRVQLQDVKGDAADKEPVPSTVLEFNLTPAASNPEVRWKSIPSVTCITYNATWTSVTEKSLKFRQLNSAIKQKSHLAVELTKDEAYSLFLKLERIQEQLDALT